MCANIKMYRITLIIATIGSLSVHGYAASAATSNLDTTLSDTSRILSILDFEDDKEDTDHAAGLHKKELEQQGSIIADAFRHQFRDVIEELLLHAFTYLRSTLHELKVKLLKKLGKYTVSDLVHVMFNGVANLVVEPTDLDLALNVDEEHARPSYGYSQYPYAPHPYFLRSV